MRCGEELGVKRQVNQSKGRGSTINDVKALESRGKRNSILDKMVCLGGVCMRLWKTWAVDDADYLMEVGAKELQARPGPRIGPASHESEF